MFMQINSSGSNRKIKANDIIYNISNKFTVGNDKNRYEIIEKENISFCLFVFY